MSFFINSCRLGQHTPRSTCQPGPYYWLQRGSSNADENQGAYKEAVKTPPIAPVIELDSNGASGTATLVPFRSKPSQLSEPWAGEDRNPARFNPSGSWYFIYAWNLNLSTYATWRTSGTKGRTSPSGTLS